MVGKALKGLATVNLSSLRFSADPVHFLSYLRDLDCVHQLHTIYPLQRRELSELLGGVNCESMFLPLGEMRPLSTPLPDMVALAALSREKHPNRIFEIGTFEGLTTVVFVKNSGADVQVHTLDLPHDKQVPRTQRSRAVSVHGIAESYVSGRLIDVFGIRQQVQALFGDSALFDFRPFHNEIDLFFVDGAHSEDYVALDSFHAFECLAPDGWVVWHDCLNPHVLKALREIARTVKVTHVSGTNLALTIGKPPDDFLNRLACKEIR